ncbi:4,5-DOPA dioxygenase extradiol [Agarivorans aestuarii]|uniref:4,5-DOPA dioxygenase extradiol n=1 Tax=Agarivorans aestuarii TaxID=1563703 RepID=A0ABU7G364_9ALTE|nr:4,5-DOPA dioxygenase extradiol [Agarivorans aestuarii]MEE1673745.1 4,5-DOPA dioxygenase extradiol [Agarivorans aestuarii]
MVTLQALNTLSVKLAKTQSMPVVFIGHGNPMNAIEENRFNQSWSQLGQALPRPQAILMISAHWTTKGISLVDNSAKPKTIHDFYGFPEALSAQRYPAKGDPVLAQQLTELLSEQQVQTDNSWGLDHGAWSVLKWMYPAADVPVFQLSIDVSKDLSWHFALGRSLSALRKRGVLIIGSGNVVHNLAALKPSQQPYEWAQEFDALFAKRLEQRQFTELLNPAAMGGLMRMANPSIEHYIPAITVAGASSKQDQLSVVCQGVDLGAISMRSFVFHQI